METAGFTLNRKQFDGVEKTVKNDDAFSPSWDTYINLSGTYKINHNFNTLFWEKYYKDYAENFDVLKTSGNHNSYTIKMQKTKIGGGYHIWHYESPSRHLSNRLLTWTLYLNDVEEGGETEFLYQHMRVKPKEGTLLIWPAAFTHTHRGNPPLSNEKYIITGWVEF